MFSVTPGENGKPLPQILWDSQITNAQRLSNLKEIHLINYRLIEGLAEPDEDLVTVSLLFAEVNHDIVPVTVNERIQPLDMAVRQNYNAYSEPFALTFLIEFAEIEEFLREIKTQLNNHHTPSCDLIIK